MCEFVIRFPPLGAVNEEIGGQGERPRPYHPRTSAVPQAASAQRMRKKS
ncbi:hypothetical protein HUB98_22770 [Paenibacillus barcinonensis]|uniref:Uncharacterized protein n=1 Tax=Paenibacillus barcinonensis TaxID=198119 RepID=A0ABX6Q984_PAEBA|nr:hypothetical protein [Paenibacillus barcinonensis]QKS58763.1 hypothetical protein HUB98_22765 [Paenibacillus barcinonensis]QKS58764.1 hypothetical protein HUB98_22770 [Paenibacillus barcinonensis]